MSVGAEGLSELCGGNTRDRMIAEIVSDSVGSKENRYSWFPHRARETQGKI